MAHINLAILRRRVFTILSVLSLLLCLAMLVLLYQSFGAYDRLLHRHVERDTVYGMWAESHGGCITFFSNAWQPQPTLLGESGWVYHRNRYDAHVAYDNLLLRSFFGFGVVEKPPSVRGFSIPHWSLALLFAILPSLYLRSFIRTRRRVGLCRVCGYDLRATPERCPECGTLKA